MVDENRVSVGRDLVEAQKDLDAIKERAELLYNANLEQVKLALDLVAEAGGDLGQFSEEWKQSLRELVQTTAMLQTCSRIGSANWVYWADADWTKIQDQIISDLFGHGKE